MCFSAGSTELVGLLLEQGAIVTATDHHGSTPLHLACQKGHQSTVVRPLQTNIMQAVIHASQHNLLYMYILVNESCRRKEARSKQGRTNNKAKQHSTSKAVIFPKEK